MYQKENFYFRFVNIEPSAIEGATHELSSTENIDESISNEKVNIKTEEVKVCDV